jgi:hypothetical protein
MQERRSQPRMLCADLVKIHFRDQLGRQRTKVANLEDISLTGACIQLDDPLPKETSLRIAHPKGEFRGRVRYCFYREIGYFIGVEFEPGCEWSRRQYVPEHILDLRQLVSRSMKRAVKQVAEAGQH